MRCNTMLILVAMVLGTAGRAGAEWNPDPYVGGNLLSPPTGYHSQPAALADGSGGTFVAWIELDEVYAQRIDRNGDPLWTVGGVAGTVGAKVDELTLVTDGAGGVLVLWVDFRVLVATVIYGQRLDAWGVPQWAAGGVALSGSGTTFVNVLRQHMSAVSDQAGGAIICWDQYNRDRQGLESTFVVRAQRIDASGTRLWGTNGLGLSALTGPQARPVLVSDLQGGAIVAWDEVRTTADIYAQRLLPAGTASWTTNGVLCSSGYHGFDARIATDEAGGAILAWSSSGNIYARRVNASGALVWNYSVFNYPVPVCQAAGNQADPRVVSDGSSGGWIAWTDERDVTTGQDIFIQRIDAGGNAIWTPDGISVNWTPKNQAQARLAPDGMAGVFVVWFDFRGADPALYGTHVRSNAGYTWGGIPVAAAGSDQSAQVIVPDGDGAAVVVWQDYRAGWVDIYAQRFDPYDRLGDPAPEILAVEDVPNDQGGQVKISWAKSYLDDIFAPGGFDYQVFRLVDPATLVLETTQPAAAAGEYSAVVSTAADSGATPGFFTYVVRARWSGVDSGPSWYSTPDSGYSVDNFPPSPITELAGSYFAGTTTLTWTPATDEDLAAYRVYRGDRPHFVAQRSNLIGETTVSTFVDVAGAPFAYQVTAVDRHGQESPAVVWLPGGISLGRFTNRLGFPSPNPARASTALAYSLAVPGRVTLSIWDVAGRLVQEHTTEGVEPGEHRIEWDLRDGAGVRVASGIYFARLSTGTGILGNRTLVVVR